MRYTFDLKKISQFCFDNLKNEKKDLQHKFFQTFFHEDKN